MTVRDIPVIDAFQSPLSVDWEIPETADARYTPVRAAGGNDPRTLNIFGRIGEDFDGTGITDRMVSGALRNMGAGPVTVNINSRGGDFFTGVNIYSQLREHEGEVTTRVLGLAASAASIIAMASDTLQVAKAAFIMIHNAHGIVMGGAVDMEAAASMFRQFDSAMAGVYADRSGMSRKEIESFMEAETFFSGEDAVKNGLADELLASDQVAPDDTPKSEGAHAFQRIDRELAEKGMPRTERRALLALVTKGTPGATQPAMPCAGDALAMQSAIAILSNFKRGIKS